MTRIGRIHRTGFDDRPLCGERRKGVRTTDSDAEATCRRCVFRMLVTHRIPSTDLRVTPPMLPRAAEEWGRGKPLFGVRAVRHSGLL